MKLVTLVCMLIKSQVARIRNGHPTSESHILRGGRLLGELLPLRAFGDVRYKWPLELQKVKILLNFWRLFIIGSSRTTRRRPATS